MTEKRTPLLTIENHHDQLEQKPPVWAAKQDPDLQYFINVHGEQWIALATGDEFLLTGGDIGWDTRSIAKPDYASLREGVFELNQFMGFAPLNLTVNVAEACWLAAVFQVAYERFQWKAGTTPKGDLPRKR